MPEDLALSLPVAALRAIDPAEIGLRRQLFRPWPAIGFELAGQPARLDDIGEAPNCDFGWQAELLVAGHRAWLSLPDPLLDLLIAQADSSVEAAAIESERLALVLELALVAPIERIEALSGQPIRLLRCTRAQPDSTPTLRLGARLTLGEAEFRPVLALAPDAATLVAPLLGPPIRDVARFGVATALRCELGRSWLALADLRRLGAGDVVLPAEPLHSPLHLPLILAERFQAHGALSGRKITVTDRFIPFSDEEPVMPSDAPSGVSDTTLDSVPIRLIFEVGRLDIPLAELGDLAPGQVLELPGDAKAPIGILANGRRIGAGELVRIGEHVGIRIVGLGVPDLNHPGLATHG